MTLIKINIENKDKVKQKSEILNKLNKIQKLVDNDEKYNELVYNIVTNATLHKKNIKINLDNYGNYKVIDSKNKILSGGFFNFGAVGSLFQKTNAQEPKKNKNNLTESEQKSQAEQVPTSQSEQVPTSQTEKESDSEEEQIPPSQTEKESDSDSEQESDSEVEQESEEESVPGSEQAQEAKVVPTSSTPVVEEQTQEQTQEPKKGLFSFLGIGGHKDQYSSDEESTSFNKYQTMMFHQDNDDNLMQHMKNMTNKKYLNNLTIQELKDIMKSNQMRVTNNGSYYNKKEMVGKIYNFYK